MKITKNGKPPDSTLVGRCANCQCEVQCKVQQAKYTEPDYNRPGECGGYSIKCPMATCGKVIYLKAKK